MPAPVTHLASVKPPIVIGSGKPLALAHNSNMVKHYPYRPSLQGPFLERFHRKVHLLCSTEASLQDVDRISREEFLWATKEEEVNPRQRRVYRAVWMLLRDLLLARWTCRWNEGVVEVAPPESLQRSYSQQEAQEIKNHLRAVMREARRQKLYDSQEFVSRMESPAPSGLARHSITALIADGRLLSCELGSIAKLRSDALRLDRLRKAVQPYLQLVREGERCEHTGIRLGDIWRYFRLTWTTPAESTPGRTLLYLIRDRARPLHPIIGIASLENSPLRITARDKELGWTIDSIQRDIDSASDAEKRGVISRLIACIRDAIADLNLDDLCSRADLERPTPELLDRLNAIAQKAAVERGAALRAWEEREEAESDAERELEELERSDLGNISKAAEEALYRRKRAEQLARLLAAQEVLREVLGRPSLEDIVESFVATEKGASALWAALVAQKSKHVGTSILELNVCGAIPPYNELLGGKLVALLTLSPEVVSDYRERYGNRPSDIASRLKGEAVVRPADLVYVGTGSLYSLGSSQYNRLSLPAGLLRKDAPKIRWHYLGETTGHGTWHISRLTLQCLEEAAYGGYSDVNHVFGEGASPKLRIIRKALLTLFEGGQKGATDEFSRHAMPRLVYGAWLALNGKAYLRGEASRPDYYFDEDIDAKQASEEISDYWRQRWLGMRIQNKDVLTRVRDFKIDDFLVSQALRQAVPLSFEPIPESNQERVMNQIGSSSAMSLEFVRSLYRGSGAYADWSDADLLAKIHIQTRLDDAILKALSRGKSVVLTGNPGDGKTHLLRYLEKDIGSISPRIEVELDASRVLDDTLYERWSKARSEGRAFCVAINEAVLFSLARKFRGFRPLQEARKQVETAVSYEEVGNEGEDAEVVVFDLSLRDVLSNEVVDSVVDRLCHIDGSVGLRCGRCPATGCDLVRNQALVQDQRFRARLQEIFDRLRLRGYHATLRELTAFFSYLLFAGRDCDELIKTSGGDGFALPNLVYSGKGRLFGLLRATFDPAKITHPIWDERLVLAQGIESEKWVSDWHGELGALDAGNVDRFVTRKRAFYFLHQDGGSVLSLASSNEESFAQLFCKSDSEVIRLLVRRLNRFFGMTGEGSELRVWQSHRYDQSPRRILYSYSTTPRSSLAIGRPRLYPSMRKGFDLLEDHLLLQLPSGGRAARLRIDYALFTILSQAERGVPVLALENEGTRRIWQFMEQLSFPMTAEQMRDAHIVILDPATSERIEINVDADAKKYHEIFIIPPGVGDAVSR